jgi:excisionase family DNA binding protein
MNKPEPDNNRMTAQDVSRYLRISLSTVHHLTRTGKLKSKKVGKQWIYSKSDIDRYLEIGFDDILTKELTVATERRLYERRKCLIQGKASVSMSNRPTWEGTGKVLDFSKGGLLFETDAPFEVPTGSYRDAYVVIKIQLPALKNVEYGFEGRIAHVNQRETSRFGIQFKELIPADSEALLARLG